MTRIMFKENNEPFEKKLRLSELPKSDLTSRPGVEPKKRHRRTKAEMAADGKISGSSQTMIFDDSGYELMSSLIKSYFDMQGRRYQIPEEPVEKYIDFSRNIMKIANFYMGKYAKPVYFLITTSAFQGFTLLSERHAIIKAMAKKPELLNPVRPVVLEGDHKKPDVIYGVPDNRTKKTDK